MEKFMFNSKLLLNFKLISNYKMTLRTNMLFLCCLAFMIALGSCKKSSTTNASENTTMKTYDPHSYALPSEAVMTHLNWTADIDFEKKIIQGVARISIHASEDAKKIMLDTKGLEIDKVTVGLDESPTEFSLAPAQEPLGSALEVEIQPGTKIINIYYKTSPGAEALQWLSPVQTAGGKHPFLFTQSQAILARSWIPLQDSPGIRFTYEATVTVPASLLALMSAENPQKKNSDGVYNFTMKQPIPAYLMALAVGDLEFEPIGPRTGVYAEPEVIEKAAYEFAEVDKMLEAAEALYGAYQWERYDLLVLPPSFPFGGMENPRLTFATPTILAGDRSLTSLVAHELAHSWSGNLVTNATWNDFWLNEGFTVYFENRIMEEVFGPSYSEMLASLAMQDLKSEVEEMKKGGNAADTRLKLDLKGRNPDDGVTSIAYDKGYFFLRTLEEKVGRERFDRFLAGYFKANAFKTMTTEDFIDYTNDSLFTKNNIPIDSTLYEQWIYGEGLPAQLPMVSSARFEQVDSVMGLWQAGKPAKSLNTTNWSTHEWLHFIRQLPDQMNVQKMRELDEAFGFTLSGNTEILTAWFTKAIRNKYTPTYKALEDFLVEVGRRKFLVPLYGEMIKTDTGRKMALTIYKKARPNYHFVAVNTLDDMLSYNP